MILRDWENEERIINPYIKILSRRYSKNKKWIVINVSTFGDCQDRLVHPNDDETIVEYKARGIELYKVVAMVGNYTGFFSLRRDPEKIKVSHFRRSETLLGLLSEDVMEEKLPKTFEFFKSNKEKLEKRV